MARYIKHDFNKDGIDRRGFLECMAWAGTGRDLDDGWRRVEVAGV